MKLNIMGITLGVILGVPTIALGSSFTYSLVQGQSPAEAFTTIGDQINSLFGRVSILETEQASTDLELEKLKLENENLRLKTEQVSAQAEQIRAKDDRMARCTFLASQIDEREDVVKKPFENQIKPLNDELRQLRTRQASEADNFSPEEFKDLKDEIDSLRKQIGDIHLEMEKEVDAVRETPEMEALLNELNNVLLCA